MPKPKDGGSVVYNALTSKGLVVPAHASEIRSSISTDNNYDQVAYLPSTSKNCIVDWGAFDYDKAAFSGL